MITRLVLLLLNNSLILSYSFVGCHDVVTEAGGIPLTNYTEVSSNIAIIQGSIEHDIGVSPMPKFASKLPDSTIQMLNCWVEQGMLNN